MAQSKFTKFQNQIWDALPERKHVAGKERIFDAVSIIVQEWPEEELANLRKGGPKAVRVAIRLNKTLKRQMHLLYGEEDFSSLWAIALNVLVSMIIRLILDWWLKDELNRKALRIWRRKWVKDADQ